MKSSSVFKNDKKRVRGKDNKTAKDDIQKYIGCNQD